MTDITVRFYTLWRQYLGIDKVEIRAEDIEGALAQVDEKYGTILREELQAHGVKVHGKIQDFSLVLLHNKSLRSLEETALQDGDVLHIFPPVLGG